MRHLVAALLLLTALPAWAAKLYKWVDENGVVHYSDTVPPQAAPRGREELDERGLTVRRIERAPTPEELAAAEAERRRREEAERRAREQAERDRRLLATYSSLADIARARDEALNALEGLIQVAAGTADNLRAQLDRLLRQAAAHERGGEAVPEPLRREIGATRRQIAEHEAFIRAKREEQARLRARFEAEMARFRELAAERDGAGDRAAPRRP
ncbi:DUF4124 domain-containing protein [Inmirania thermothiophila]|uniref:Uncharacterized protein DUF4124 n=1 Tax=Inmirania thermothiophila TaxID=1750597 RepID=A0A3N1Y7I5_9GAMM|nr:DUF4124 domain-containing protein [Inmirania thermothiophila]ROR34481.1 uncharacterized protein DUF4124 [Inmirania thermothiophila]